MSDSLLPSLPVRFRAALPEDAAACLELRGRTRQNALAAERLAQLGITAESWGRQVREGRLLGVLGCSAEGPLAGYCFGDADSGEIVVLALLPGFEGRGLGKSMLTRMVEQLQALGHRRLFLGCSDDAGARSHGFYRHLGWRPTGRRDALGDEELELLLASGDAE